MIDRGILSKPTRKAAYFLFNRHRVFVGARLSEPARLRLFNASDPFIAGWPALLAVALAGITLGFFGWYAIVVPHHRPSLSELGLLAGLAYPLFGPAKAGPEVAPAVEPEPAVHPPRAPLPAR